MKDQSIRIFIVLTALFIASLVIADVIGSKAIQFLPHNISLLGWEIIPIISAGIIPFALTFVITDLVNEFYGPKKAQFLTWIGFFISLLVIALLAAAVWAPTYKGSVISENEFAKVFSQSQRIFFASSTAYLLAQFVDIYIFSYLRKLTAGRMLWLRIALSTVLAQIIDSFIVCFIAYSGLMKSSEIFSIGFNNYSIKFFIAIALTPICYLTHELIKPYLQQSHESEF